MFLHTPWSTRKFGIAQLLIARSLITHSSVASYILIILYKYVGFICFFHYLLVLELSVEYILSFIDWKYCQSLKHQRNSMIHHKSMNQPEQTTLLISITERAVKKWRIGFANVMVNFKRDLAIWNILKMIIGGKLLENM